ncbi:MAG: hypothetical protein V1885_01485 [Candidatus Brennerbacteria bacterium]
MDQLWTPEIEARAKQARSFGDLGGIGGEVLYEIGKIYGPKVKLGMVSGPISNGGLGSVAANMEAFERTVSLLQILGTPLFSQLPFEPHMWRIAESEGADFDPKELLEGFYFPLLMSGRIGALYFIHGWESSNGARWEHEQALSVGLQRVFLPEGFHLLQICRER